jgi:glycine oxidase
VAFDAVIIGGGVIGCAIAWKLAEGGTRVALIERGQPGRESSYAAGGMLAAQAESDPRTPFFKLATASRNLYPDFVRRLEATSGIAVEYRRDGTLMVSLRPEDDEEIENSFALQKSLGLNVELLTREQMRKIEPSLSSEARFALRFADDHQVDNRLLTLALERAAVLSGAEIFTGVEAREVVAASQRDAPAQRRSRLSVETSKHRFDTDHVVIAAGCWSGSILTPSPLLANAGIAPVRGQMIALSAGNAELNHVVYSHRGYLIPRSSGAIIAGSTTENAGFNKSVTAGGIASIIASAIETMPMAKDMAIAETWAGLRPGTDDGQPVLGEDPHISGLYYATGHYRNGILLSPITAEAIAQLILTGSAEVDLSPFSITRFADRAAAG